VPISGGSPVQLNSILVTDGDVLGFRITADGQRVVYRADQVINGAAGLYSLPIDGSSPPIQINRILVNAENVAFDFQISPDNQRVIYRDTNDSDELYSTNITGGVPIRLNTNLAANGNVRAGVKISADSQRVIYLADQTIFDVFELYSVPIGGGTPIRLNTNLPSGGDVFSSRFEISADSQRVVYLADQNVDNVNELFSVAINGGAPTRLNTALGVDNDVFNYRISPDSQQVVYLSNQDVFGVSELYSVPIVGGSPTQLNPTLAIGGNVTNTYRFSADGQRVIYRY